MIGDSKEGNVSLSRARLFNEGAEQHTLLVVTVDDHVQREVLPTQGQSTRQTSYQTSDHFQA